MNLTSIVNGRNINGRNIGKRIVFTTIILILLTTTNVLGASPWWDTSRHFRLPVTVGSSSFERLEKPVEVDINFTQLINGFGQSDTLDENSVRVVEIDSLGTTINASILFQFDKDSGYNPTTKASGTIVFIMDGTTPANTNRYYHVYFNLTGGSYSPISITPLVILTDNIVDEGQSSYMINTGSNTYYFQKQAGGFSSWNDISGIDWIDYNSAVGSAGAYRGIPNAVYPGGIFHPGFTCCISSTVTKGPIKIRIRSISNDGLWESIWDFYPKYATMTMTKANGNYWFLYEGTPGGILEPNIDFMFRSNGVKTYLNQSWYSDIISNEWAYFSDPTLDRSLFVAHRDDDTLQDMYNPMDTMTVFGFGRNEFSNPLLSSVPQRFTIGLIGSTDFVQNSKTIYSAYKDLTVTKGTAEKHSSSNQQLTLLDVTYNHTNSTKAFSFFNLPSGIPSDLISPIDYAHGTLYQKLQIITKPSDKTVKYQICIFQDQIVKEKHACSNEGLLTFTGSGTYYANQNMVTLFQYNNISWNRSLLKEMLVVKDRNGIPVDNRYGWDGLWNGSPDFDLYYPMNVRYIAIIVPPGGGQPTWPPDNNINLSITSSSPTVNPNTIVGTSQTFSINTNKKADVIWSIDGFVVKTETGVTTSSYVNSTVGVGTHNVNIVASNSSETKSREWIWTVDPVPVQIVYIPPTPIITNIATGNFWIKYALQPGIGNKTDSYNVNNNINGIDIWANRTVNTNFNYTVGPHGRINTTAFAGNNSGGISLTPAIENMQVLNNVPTQNEIGDKTVIKGTLLTFIVSAKDTDSDIMTYNTSAVKGTLDSSTGIYSWVPNNSDVGEYTWSFCSNDSYGGTDCETINIEVKQLEYIPPTPVDLVCTQGNFWINCTWNPGIGNNTDIYNIDINGESIDVIENYYNFSVEPHAQRNILVRAYNVSGIGSLNETPISGFVQLINNDPVQNEIGSQILIIGQLLIFTVSATDEDGDPITYNTSATKGLWDSSTGVYSWYPDNKDIGIYMWTFCSKDGHGGNDCETVTFDVNTTSPLKVNITEPKQNRAVRFIDNIVKGEVIGLIKSAVLNVRNKDNVIVSSYNLTSKLVNNKFIQRVEYAPNQRNTLELIAVDNTDDTSKDSIYVNIGNNIFESTRQVNIGEEIAIDSQNETGTNITLFSNISSLATFRLLAITNISEIDKFNNDISGNSEASLGRLVDIQIDGINTSNGEDLQNLTINLYYTKKDLDLDGDNKLEVGELDENRISFYWYDNNSGDWKKLSKGDPQWIIDAGIIKMTNNTGYTWIKGRHLSRFALAAGTKLPQTNPGTGGTNSGSTSGSGGGGGGGLSGENYNNIEVKERHELDVYRDRIASYIFSDKRNPIMFVNITGNTSNSEITTTVEVLKNRSSLLKVTPPGLVYKNINIWVGSSSFPTPKNIKSATITFRVENSWIDNSSIRNNVKMVRRSGGKWITLQTSEITKDNNYTYFKTNTTGFSQFAIIGLKNDKVNKPVDTVKNKVVQTPNNPQIKQTEAITPNTTKSTSGFDMFTVLLIIVLIVLIVYIIRQKE